MALKKKLILGVLLAGGVGAGGYYGYDYYNTKDIVTVQSGEVVRQDLAQSVAANGEIKPKKSVNISSTAMSSQIKSNDAAIASAKAEITRAQAEVSRSKLNLDRADSMMKEGLIPRQQYDTTKSDYDVAVTGVAAARARLDQAEAQAAQT